MRIALIRRRYTPLGGAERYAAAVAEGLARRGHEVHLFAERWSGDGGGPPGLTLHRVPVPPGPSFARVLAFAAGAARAVSRGPYDAVVSFERTLRQDVYRAGDGCHREWLLRRGAAMPPARRALMRANPLHATYLWLEGRIFRDPRCRLIIANSRRGRDEIVRHYGTDPGRIAVLYTGVDLEAYHPRHRAGRREAVRRGLGMAEGELVLLFVGSGFERKGLGPLLRALDLLRRDAGNLAIRLLVAGRREVRYERMVRRLGLQGRVTFLGGAGNVADLCAGADAFILPSLYDPFSNACLEAMAAGLPPITSRANGTSELIEDGVEGFVLDDPTDPRAIAKAVLAVGDPAAREAMGAAARRRAEAHPFDDHVDRLLALIEGAARS
ncbi:MAG TPA: glycosyltransferase family 4 protein [Candidatus Sulfotelmatobacter sp.]|nr:glycosyltransferase family 4 protein [Candidatus Sulfotelmatobacter sp.]